MLVFFPFVLPLLDLIPPHPGLCTEKKPNLILCDLKERKTEKEEQKRQELRERGRKRKEGRSQSSPNRRQQRNGKTQGC